MREIKFRVWDNVNYMSNPFTLNDLVHKKIQFADECVVMQSTGLQDNNCREIYEGDILKGSDYGDPPSNWKVEFVDGEWRAISINDPTFSMAAKYFKYLEVIGNIFETPELI